MIKTTRISIIIIACLVAAAVGMLSLPVNDALAADPACPSSWPDQGYDGPLREPDRGRVAYEDYFTDSDDLRWFVIRSSDSNGYTTVRAYPATADGYITNSPDEVCYLVVRRPGDAEDAAEPRQVVFREEKERPPPLTPSEYARLLVHRALTMYGDEGLEATLIHYNSPQSVDGPWYVFIIEDRDGVLYSVASANRPDLVGTTSERIDANGFHYGKAFAAITEEGGGEWVTYLFTHPATGEDALKHSWVVRRGNLLFGAGWYEGIDTAVNVYAAEAAQFLPSFTADHSPRASATEEELAAAQTLKAHLERLGYETALQDFTVLSESAEVAFDPAPEAVPDSEGALPLSNSGTGTVTAPLLFAGMALKGEVPDDIQGTIALIERGEITFQEKVQRVAEAGALAAVIYNNVDGDFLGSMNIQASIPAVSIDRQTGLRLRELMGEGTVESTVSVIHTESPSRNIVANKPGVATPDNVVIVGTHYDTAPNVPGANDSGAGIATVLSVAKHIADKSYPFTVKLVLFGSQVNGLFGSYHHVETMNAEEQSNVRAMINFDVVGSGRALQVNGDESLRQTTLTLAKDLGAAVSSSWSLPEGPISDHFPFAEVGIPSVIIAADDISRIHTADDTLEYINPYLIGWAAEIAIALLDDLAAPE